MANLWAKISLQSLDTLEHPYLIYGRVYLVSYLIPDYYFCESVMNTWSKHSLASQLVDLVNNIQKYKHNKEKRLIELNGSICETRKSDLYPCLLLLGHVNIIRVCRVLVYYS